METLDKEDDVVEHGRGFADGLRIIATRRKNTTRLRKNLTSWGTSKFKDFACDPDADGG